MCSKRRTADNDWSFIFMLGWKYLGRNMHFLKDQSEGVHNYTRGHEFSILHGRI